MFILVRDVQVFLIKIMIIIQPRRLLKLLFQVSDRLRKKHLNKVAVDLESAGLMLKGGGSPNGILSTVSLRNTGQVMVSI